MPKRQPSPHIGRSYSGAIKDYNGVGRWSVAAVQQRYREYSRALGVAKSQVPTPQEQDEGEFHWIFPIMFSVIEGIKRGDAACTEIGVELIEEPEFFVFGRILKSNTARALRGAKLTATQIERLRRRMVSMLLSADVPHEFHEYAKLLRHIGVGEWWPSIEERIQRDNSYVRRYYEYLRKYAKPNTSA
jgi:hypothetical protein